jgi:hypothetical protein
MGHVFGVQLQFGPCSSIAEIGCNSPGDFESPGELQPISANRINRPNRQKSNQKYKSHPNLGWLFKN